MKLRIPAFGLDGYVAIGAALVALAGVLALVWGIHDHGKKAQWKKDEPIIVGLKADLNRCHINVGRLDDVIERNNAQAKKDADASAAREKTLKEQLKAAEKRRAEAQEKARKLERYRAKGATLCERLIDADRYIMEVRSK